MHFGSACCVTPFAENQLKDGKIHVRNAKQLDVADLRQTDERLEG